VRRFSDEFVKRIAVPVYTGNCRIFQMNHLAVAHRRLPMHVIASTSELAIAIHSVTSIANDVRLGLRLITRCRVSC